ncbi:hypothetical protein EF773_08125 [Escherichia coli]|nr:hypothetical protein [Escherichia coli]
MKTPDKLQQGECNHLINPLGVTGPSRANYCTGIARARCFTSYKFSNLRPNVPLLIFCLIPFLIGLKAHSGLHFASQKMGHFYVPMSHSMSHLWDIHFYVPVSPFSGECVIMFVIPVPLKRNAPFRRSWWTHSHTRLTLCVSITDPQTAITQWIVT